MRVIIQRVQEASVKVEDQVIGEIKHGLMVLVGFEEEDTMDDFQWMSKKIVQLRIFNDDQGVMNKSIQDVDGELLIVSQFTLHAMIKKGNRPSYIKASKPVLAEQQYNDFLKTLASFSQNNLQTGVFGADMKVSLINDGPVTLFIDTKNKE